MAHTWTGAVWLTHGQGQHDTHGQGQHGPHGEGQHYSDMDMDSTAPTWTGTAWLTEPGTEWLP